MARSWKCVELFIFVLVLVVVHTQNPKLNVPRVLLPLFKDFCTNFTLEVSDSGCYKWTTSRIDLIRLILPEEEDYINECSTSVVVSAISKERTRNTAIVFAEDRDTGLILRCDVIVDVISSLALVTTTRELYIEEAPEAFEVRAYDDQGNEFSTLEGVEFHWSLNNWNAHKETSSTGCYVLRFITFKDSPYETPSTVQIFDEIGKHGHIVLLEGMKTGSAKVSVRLPHAEYQHVIPIELQLMVVANLIIDPGDMYILLEDVARFRVLQVHHGRLEEIPLPSKQYYLEVENGAVARIDEQTSLLTGVKKGKTKVLLHDRNVDETESGVRIPAASVTVGDPCYLTLAILPHRNWIVMIDERYEIVVEIYDSADHKFYIGDGVEVSVFIPKEYFHVDYSTKNNTHNFGWPVTCGATQVNATLEGVRDSSGYLHPTPRISAIADMLIYDRVVIHPCEIALPWDPFVEPTYEVSLNATGGDGSYIWNSYNTSVAVVTQTGLVKTYARGQTEVSAAMTRNHYNRDAIEVHIMPASHLEIVEYVLEEEIGVPIYLHVAVYGDKIDSDSGVSTRIPFSHCDDMPLIVKTWNDNFVNVSLKILPVGISCTTVAVIGNAVGSSKVTVSYSFEELTISDSALIGSYRPLAITVPESGETVLAVGTSREVVFVGGPRPWIGRSSEHVHEIIIDGPADILEVVELEDILVDFNDRYVYRVLCRKLGEVDVKLYVANNPSVGHCKKSFSLATLKVRCAKPRYVILDSVIKDPQASACPLNVISEKLVVENYNDVELLVTVKDEHGRPFDNITTLFFDWKLSHPSLGSILERGTVLIDDVVEEEVRTTKRNYQILKPNGRTGVLEVTIAVVAYQAHLLAEMDIVPEDPPFGIANERGYVITPEITATMSLILVNDTIVTPNQSLVFNHPKNKVYIQVNQGSGYYEFIVSSEAYANVRYIESTRQLEIIPMLDGELKIGLVDLCLPNKAAIVDIRILGVGSLELEVPERVERGKCVTAKVLVYDTIGNLLPIPNTEFLDLRPHPDSGMIGVKMQAANKKTPLPTGEVHYVVTGLELGETGLKFVSGRGNRESQSQTVYIQVFPPLRLFPRNMTLIAGSKVQITCRGGPQPDANVEFELAASDLATISSTGVVTGQLEGSSVITGRALGVNKVTGQTIVYSEDSILLNVIILQAVKIHAPLTRLKTGTTMPVYARGIPETLSPIIIGDLEPPLRFTWSVSTREVGIIRHMFEDFGLDLYDEDKVNMHFTAVSPGRTILRMEIFVGDMTEPLFHDAREIEVFAELLLTYPPFPNTQQAPVLVMSPHSSVQLKTNRDGLAQKVTYSLGGKLLPSGVGLENETVSKALVDPDQFITVERNGVVRSHNRLGRSVIMVVAKEDFGVRQVISLSVEVKEILYIMLTPVKIMYVEEGESLRIIPRGFSLDFTVSFHDNTGSTFTSTTSLIKLKTNRYDLAQIRTGKTNNTITAILMSNGATNLRVWDEMSPLHTTDYAKLNVGDVIFPEKTKKMLHSPKLTVGDLVCFHMNLYNNERKYGTWETDNENVLQLEPQLGIGKVRGPGSVVVRYHLTPYYTFVDLEAVAVNQIKFLPPPNLTLINSDLPNLRVPIVLTNTINVGKNSNLITRNGTCPFANYPVHNFPFMCELRFDNPVADVDVDEVFGIYQDFDMVSGTYGCVIISSGVPTLNKSLLTTNFSLHVFSGSVISNPPLKIPFIPSVFVHSKEVNLSDARMSGYIAVSGRNDILKALKVEAAEGADFLKVQHGGYITEEHKVIYYVLLTDKYWKDADLTTRMSIHIISKMTFQVEEVIIKVRLVGGSWTQGPCVVSRLGFPVSETVYFYRNTFTILGSVIVIILVTLFVLNYYVIPWMQTAPPYQPRGSVYHGSTVYAPPVYQSQMSITDPLLQSSTLYRPSMMSSGGTRYPRQSAMNMEPIYGDPQLYYGSSQDVQGVRSRRVF